MKEIIFKKNELLELKEIKLSEKEKLELIENKNSFVLFVYQDLCVNSYNFEKVLNEFVNVCSVVDFLFIL